MDPITASYGQEDADWTISVSGLGKTLTARAPGIIAARDRADQLVEKLAPDQPGRTVVHLLNGSALEFTATYLRARLTRPSAEEVAKAAEAAAAPAAPAKKPRKSAAAQSKPAGTKPRRAKPAAKPAAKRTNGAEVPGVIDEAAKPVAKSGRASG